MQRILTVPDMSCQSCVASVSQAVQAVPGVSAVDVNLAQGTVQVTAPVEVATADLAAAITAVGYQVADATPPTEPVSAAMSGCACCV